MANALGTLFGDIAGAIREKSGETGTMKPAEFPEKISAIKTEPVLQNKTITENGTYAADEGFDGLGEVTVEVAGAGGGSLPAGAYWEVLDVKMPTTFYSTLIEYNGYVYCFTNTTKGNGFVGNVYKLVNGVWQTIVTGVATYMSNPKQVCFVEYNGKIHILGGSSTKHYVFNGASFTALTSLLKTLEYECAFVQDNKLKAYSYSDKTVYVWNETADSWSVESVLSPSNAYMSFVNIDGVIYCSGNYIYANGKLISNGFSNAHTIGNYGCATIGKKHYYVSSQNSLYRVFVTDFEKDVASRPIAILPNYCSYGTDLFEYDGALCAIIAANGGEVSSFAPMKLHEVAE